jgi:DNA-binding IclR family transcriptional regulator
MGSIERAVQVLQHIAEVRRPVGVRECARHLDLPRSAVHRVIRILATLRLLERDSEGGYTIGPLAYAIGRGFVRGNDVIQLGMHQMETALADVTSHLGKLDGQRVLILAAHEGQGPVRVTVHSGEHYYVHCTALGKVLIASLSSRELRQIIQTHGLPRRTPHTITAPRRLEEELKSVREHGFAVVMEENALGVASIGAPIATNGETVAAISISVPLQDVRAKSDLLRSANRVKAAAEAISRSLRSGNE